MKIVPIILSGGSGQRLWPLSRKQHPKQYLALAGKNTMLQETILRLTGIKNISKPIIICNEEHRFLVAEQCKEINITNPTIILEPDGRNTAPAITAAAIHLNLEMDEVMLLVLSADHIIQDTKAFHESIKEAIKHSQANKIVTFGVKPTEANTNFGYIKTTKKIFDGACRVEEFIEKPSLKKAQHFLEQGNYLWNSGIFLFKSTVFIDELNNYSPQIFRSVDDAVKNASQDFDFIRLNKKAFLSSPSNSIDYVVMEKSEKVVVVHLNAGWNDIGSWLELYKVGEKDTSGNVLKGDIFTRDTTNSYINSNHRMVTTVGVDNLIIIETADVTFVADKEKAHDVKSIVEFLKNKGREESLFNRKVHRPWGWFNLIETCEFFQVKRLHIRPRGKLSLQMHKKRAEHWLVVKGSAKVINGSDMLILNEGDSTFIPCGTKHSIENITKGQLEIIEVQSGTYFGEDDIIRFEDIYGRNKT